MPSPIVPDVKIFLVEPPSEIVPKVSKRAPRQTKKKKYGQDLRGDLIKVRVNNMATEAVEKAAAEDDDIVDLAVLTR